jgi:hypothetical protein
VPRFRPNSHRSDLGSCKLVLAGHLIPQAFFTAIHFSPPPVQGMITADHILGSHACHWRLAKCRHASEPGVQIRVSWLVLFWGVLAFFEIEFGALLGRFAQKLT